MSTPLMAIWRPIAADDLPFFQAHYERFDNYSDFNPMCLYAFLANGFWARLGDTIILDVEDPLYGGKYCSIFGEYDCYESIALLLELDRVRGANGPLLLHHVPKPTATALKGLPGIRHVTHDSNNDDYIFSVHKLIQLDSENLTRKRKMIDKLCSLHPRLHTIVIDHAEPKIIEQIMHVFDNWVIETQAADFSGERQALYRLLQLKSPCLTVVGTYDGPQLIAFTVNEAEKNNFYQGHFGKASRNYPNLGIYIEHETAKIMHQMHGSQYINIQQDHGIIGLRHYKKSWDPVKYLRKYIVVVDKNEYARNVQVLLPGQIPRKRNAVPIAAGNHQGA